MGSPLGWSDLFYFRAMESGTDWSARITIYGDMGNAQGFAMATLQKMAQSGQIHSILHIGNFLYAGKIIILDIEVKFVLST